MGTATIHFLPVISYKLFILLIRSYYLDGSPKPPQDCLLILGPRWDVSFCSEKLDPIRPPGGAPLVYAAAAHTSIHASAQRHLMHANGLNGVHNLVASGVLAPNANPPHRGLVRPYMHSLRLDSRTV